MQDICSCKDTGFKCGGQESVLVCVAGTFLVKMLAELVDQNKTREHVRLHLLPYLGGTATLEALKTDTLDDPACRVCSNDVATADGLAGLRATLPSDQVPSS